MDLKGLLQRLDLVVILTIAGMIGCDLGKSAIDTEKLSKKLSALRTAERDESEALIADILGDSISPKDISETLLSGIEFVPSEERVQKLVSGWSEWTATDTNGVARPYQIYLPKSVAEGAAAKAMIVHMHGGVGRPNFGTGVGSRQAVGYAGFMWQDIAEVEDFLVVCPVGRRDCKWWLDNGVAHVDAVIRDVRRSMEIPEDSIFGAGFSDGGSGCYFRAMAAPDPFAGFIAMNGNPTVASFGSQKQVYLPNMAMTRTFASMTQQDALYPAKLILPHIQVALDNHADILTVSYPKMNHEPAYFGEQSEAIVNFIKSNKRKTDGRIRWYAAEPEIGKVRELEMLEFASNDEAVEVDSFNVVAAPGNVRLGVQFATDFRKVDRVLPNSVAESAGMLVGDELLTFDGQELVDEGTLLEILTFKKFGDSFTCTVRRDGRKKKLEGLFPFFTPREIYRRDKPTGFAECQVIPGDKPKVMLKTKNVRRLRIWLPEELSSLARIQVDHNDKVSWRPVVQLSSQELLQAFAEKGVWVPRAYVEVE